MSSFHTPSHPKDSPLFSQPEPPPSMVEVFGPPAGTAPSRFGKPLAQPRARATDPALDGKRLEGQARRVWDAMADCHWWTLAEIAAHTGDPEASVSARLRDFRRIDGVTVHRRRRPGIDASRGVWEYRVEVQP